MANVVKATILGQEVELVYNSSTGKYEKIVSAPSDSSYQYNSGHYFPVTITATDEAGNVTPISDTEGDFTENLKLYVTEDKKPTITGISPTDNGYIGTTNPKIEFTVLDNANGQASGFSGIDPNSIALTVGGVSVSASEITKTAVTGGYKCSYTPSSALANGDCTVIISVKDHDGNTSDTASVTFTIDTTPPVLDVTSPNEDGIYTNQAKFKVTGKTSDKNSSPVTVDIKVNGTSQGAVTVASDGSFSKEVTLAEGTNTIVITAIDKADQRSSITRTVILKTTGPVFKTVEISPNPVLFGNLYTISVTFED